MGFSAAAAIAGTVISSAVGAYGAESAAAAQSAQAKYQSDVSKQNAQTAYSNSMIAEQQGQAKALLQEQQGDIARGKMRAAIAANGIDLNNGSALDIQSDQARNTALNVANDQYNTSLSARAFQTQGANFTTQAAMQTAAAQNDATAGLISAGGTAISGATSVAQKWNQYYGTPAATNNNTSAPDSLGYAGPTVGGGFKVQ